MPDYTPDWFNGDADAMRLLDDLGFVSHVWDDLIDQDKPVPADKISSAFERALVHIPTNPAYQRHQHALAPLMFTGIMGFYAATRMERSGDAHQVEIAHGLRYAVANVGMYLVSVLNSRERAEEILPLLWKAMMPERFDDYMKEHGHVRST
jgi:hypothetical protein